MAATLGWVNIQAGTASSVIGTDNGLVFKISGQQLEAASDIIWDSTAKTLTITGTSASSTTLTITGKITSDAIAITNDITAATVTTTGEIYAGSHSRTLSNMGQILGQGNVLTISGNEVVPADFRSLVYGPLSVSANATLAIGTGAIIAVRPDEDLPAILQS